MWNIYWMPLFSLFAIPLILNAVINVSSLAQFYIAVARLWQYYTLMHGSAQHFHVEVLVTLNI